MARLAAFPRLLYAGQADEGHVWIHSQDHSVRGVMGMAKRMSRGNASAMVKQTFGQGRPEPSGRPGQVNNLGPLKTDIL
jgi:hypothetical protein